MRGSMRMQRGKGASEVFNPEQAPSIVCTLLYHFILLPPTTILLYGTIVALVPYTILTIERGEPNSIPNFDIMLQADTTIWNDTQSSNAFHFRAPIARFDLFLVRDARKASSS